MQQLQENSKTIQYQSELTQSDGTRYYLGSDNNEYISVTTLLSRYENQDALVKWREKEGVEEAARITQESIDRGVDTHNIIEQYLSDNSFTVNSPYAKLVINMFYSRIKHISSETAVFFNDGIIKYAGRYDSQDNIQSNSFYYKDTGDLVNSGKALVDLKTKRKPPQLHKIDFILKYALQGAAYRSALKNTYGIDIDYFILVFIADKKCGDIMSDKKCNLMLFSTEQLDFYFFHFYELALHFYNQPSKFKSWKDLVRKANCTYDADLGFIDFLPREIAPII